jgi:hypothetical protein
LVLEHIMWINIKDHWKILGVKLQDSKQVLIPSILIPLGLDIMNQLPKMNMDQGHNSSLKADLKNSFSLPSRS